MERAEKAYYIKCLKERYRKSSKARKGEILTELMQELSVTRRHAIRLMNAKMVGRPKNSVKCGRPPKYADPEFRQALKQTWRITGYICSKSLKQAIPDWLPFIELEHGSYKAEIREKLLAISPPTMDRISKKVALHQTFKVALHQTFKKVALHQTFKNCLADF
jgi:predicted transcriptional regulator